MFFIFWASCFAVNIQLSVLILFAVFCFGRFGTVIPFTPGGVGTTDVIMVSTLILYGASEISAFTAVLIWRTFYYLPQVLLGVFSYFQWQLTRSKWKFSHTLGEKFLHKVSSCVKILVTYSGRNEGSTPKKASVVNTKLNVDFRRSAKWENLVGRDLGKKDKQNMFINLTRESSCLLYLKRKMEFL